MEHGTGSGTSDPSTWTTAKIFAFRQKAALFGSTAPDPNLFVNARKNTRTSLPGLIDDTAAVPGSGRTSRLPSESDRSRLDLFESVGRTHGSRWRWMVSAQLYKVTAASPSSRSAFGISGRITELAADYNDPDVSDFPLQGTAVLCAKRTAHRGAPAARSSALRYGDRHRCSEAGPGGRHRLWPSSVRRRSSR